MAAHAELDSSYSNLAGVRIQFGKTFRQVIGPETGRVTLLLPWRGNSGVTPSPLMLI